MTKKSVANLFRTVNPTFTRNQLKAIRAKARRLGIAVSELTFTPNNPSVGLGFTVADLTSIAMAYQNKTSF